ncbi:MAG: ABC transporter permease [Wujia sp.]
MGWMFRLSFMNMKRRRARTILTILGVTIGVISVVAMLALGLGVKKELLAGFTDESSVKKIVVTCPQNAKQKTMFLTERNLKKLAELDKVDYVYPRYEVDVQIKLGNYTAYCPIIGIPDEQLNKIDVVDGSEFSTSSRKPSLTMGNAMGYIFYNMEAGISYQESKGGSMEDLLGEKLMVQFGYGDDALYTKLEVSAVMRGKADDYGEDTASVFCDMETLKRYLKSNAAGGRVLGQPLDANGNPYQEWIYSSAVVVADDIQDVDFVVKKLQDMGYQTSNEKEYLETAKRTIRVIQVLLGGIGMIALVVAVIGISNTMTTSVYDRVNEIGVLKVIGCDTDELLLMFLFESGILGFVGGVLGVGCALGIKNIINKVAVSLLDFAAGTKLAVIPLWLALSGILIATLLGLLAGYIPARWASRLNPLTAVRK